jgi:uncharacterized protein
MTVILDRDVPIPLRDGTVTMADVYRPSAEGRYPVLVQRTPYDKTFFPYTWAALDPTKIVAAGYVVVIQDVRGRFMSLGDYPGPYVGEGPDGVDTIAWAASQPWSNGSVGMYGISYMGGVQWLAAAERPPALKALAPTMSLGDFGNIGAHRGGALQLGLMAAWTMSVAPNALVRRLLADVPALVRELAGFIDDFDTLDDWMRRLPLVPFEPMERMPDIAEWFARFTSDEALAASEDVLTHERYANVGAPALLVAGWYDLLIQEDLDKFVAVRERGATEDARTKTRIIIGPWAHPPPNFLPVVGQVDFGFRAAGTLIDMREDFTGLHRRWFDARLKGINTGIDDEPPVKLFVMGRNRWRSEDTWPLARAKTERWHVHGSGGLSPKPPESEQPPSTFRLDPDDPVPTRGGNLLLTFRYPRGPLEQSEIESRDDVLVFTSEPATEEIEITGPVRFVGYIAAETPDTDLIARLCDVGPDGRSFNVCDGILRLRFRDGLANPAPATPGEVYHVEVDMWSTSHVFLPGHRLRLQVRASDFPRWDRCPGTGESSTTAKQVIPQRNHLFHDTQRPSHLELPVVRV